MIASADLGGVMAMMPAFATDDAGDLNATATISIPRLEAGLRRMIDDGADVIATSGSFGECHTLSLEEFETLAVASAQIAKGRVPLFVGVTSLNTREAIRKMRIVEKTGAEGVLVGVPYYFPASPATAIQFYRDIAEACPKLAIMVYHNPPVHNITLKLPVMEQLLKIPNLVAMKDSHRNPFEFMQLMEMTRGKMSVFVYQLQYRAFAPLGAAGMWSINAWMGPWPLFALRDAVKRGDFDLASKITLDMAAVNVGGPDPTWQEAGLKVAIRYAGYIDPGPTRPPFAHVPPDVDAAQRKKVEAWKDVCARYRLPGRDITGALFAPLRVRGLTVANRFVMSPANRNASPGGVPGEDTAQFYRRRVDGETGLIITGGVGVDHPAALGASYGRPCAVPELHGEAALAGWKRVVDVVHDGGGKIVPQLWHMGNMRAAGTGYHPEAITSSPSGVWSSGNTRTFVPPADVEQFSAPIPALTDAEIVAIIDGYARSARNAAALGFDGIAIHGGNGYLVDSFLWGETNRRTDRWGGNLRERTRFAVELVRAVRHAVGEGLPIFFRFSQWKHQDLDGKNAVTPAELEDMLGPIANAGVDVFDGGQYVFDQPAFPGSGLNLAGWAKKLTGRTTMTVGSVGFTTGFYDPDAPAPPVATDNLEPLERRFARGEFDLVAVCRSLLIDPAWTRKARLGQPFEPYNEAALFAMI